MTGGMSISRTFKSLGMGVKLNERGGGEQKKGLVVCFRHRTQARGIEKPRVYFGIMRSS